MHIIEIQNKSLDMENSRETADGVNEHGDFCVQEIYRSLNMKTRSESLNDITCTSVESVRKALCQCERNIIEELYIL